MKIQALGHSCFILEMENTSGEPVRILADPWLDDHVVGDVGGRFPRVRADWSRLGPVDAVWISHAHTDHLCPYSLIILKGELPAGTALFLPISMAYLEDVFREYLPDWPIHFMAQEEAIEWKDLQMQAFFNLAPEASNEDDCMILLVSNGREAILSEADALLPNEDPEIRELVAQVLGQAGPEQRVFLTTRNELEASMASVDATNQDERMEAVAQQRQQLAHHAESQMSANGSENCAWTTPGTVRLIIGQGIGLPHEIPDPWNKVMFPLTLEDRARLEQETADREGMPVTVSAVQAGEELTIRRGQIAIRDRIEGLEVLDAEEERRFDGNLDLVAQFPVAPLREGQRDTEAQHAAILQSLQERYLPYLIGQRQPPVEHRLSASHGEIRVRIRYGDSSQWTPRDYVANFQQLQFQEVESDGVPTEEYWGNDLDDYFQGTADDFTTFCRTFPGGVHHQFWDCLGMPFLNNDLVTRKIRHHFEQAQAGKSAADFVLPLWGISSD